VGFVRQAIAFRGLSAGVIRRYAVTLQDKWRKTLHAIWRTLRVWTNWPASDWVPTRRPWKLCRSGNSCLARRTANPCPSTLQSNGLTDEARTLAFDRFRLLQPLRSQTCQVVRVSAARDVPVGAFGPLSAGSSVAHLEDNRPLKAVAAAAGIPFRIAQRWVSLYRQFGLGALAREKRTDTGQHREVSAKLKEIIEGIALQKPPLRIATICRQVRRLVSDPGEEPLSYWVVYRIVADPPVRSAHPRSRGHEGIQQHVRIGSSPGSSWPQCHLAGRPHTSRHWFRPGGEVAKPWRLRTWVSFCPLPLSSTIFA
jgi:hypothetical protein